jgi:hypothetical protein
LSAGFIFAFSFFSGKPWALRRASTTIIKFPLAHRTILAVKQLTNMAISVRRTPIAESFDDALAAFADNDRGPVSIAAAVMSALTDGNRDLYVSVSLEGGEHGSTQQELEKTFDSLKSLIYQTIADVQFHARYDLGQIVYIDLTITRGPGDSFRDALFLFPSNGQLFQSRKQLIDPLLRQLLGVLIYESEFNTSLEISDITGFEHQVEISSIFGMDALESPVRIYFNGGPPTWGAQIFGGRNGREFIEADPDPDDPLTPIIQFVRETYRLLKEINTDPPFPNDATTQAFLARLSRWDLASIDPYLKSPESFRNFQFRWTDYITLSYIVDAGPVKYVFWNHALPGGGSPYQDAIYALDSGWQYIGINSASLAGTLFDFPEFRRVLFPDLSPPAP